MINLSLLYTNKGQVLKHILYGIIVKSKVQSLDFVLC